MLPFVPLGSRAYYISEAVERVRDALLAMLENDKVLAPEVPMDGPPAPLSRAQKKRAVEKAKKRKKRMAELESWRQNFERMNDGDEGVNEERADEHYQPNRVKPLPSGEEGGCRLS